MNDAVNVFINRDGMSKAEAIDYRNEMSNDIMSMIEDGCSYDEVEDMLLGEGLEMDYLFDFLF